MKNWHPSLPTRSKFLEVFRIRPLFDPHPLEGASFLPTIMTVAFHQEPAKECSVLAPVGSDRELLKLVFHVPEPKASNGAGNKSQCVYEGEFVLLQLWAVFQQHCGLGVGENDALMGRHLSDPAPFRWRE